MPHRGTSGSARPACWCPYDRSDCKCNDCSLRTPAGAPGAVVTVLIAANAVFITVKHPIGAVIGFLIVGLHMSMTQANTKALLTEYIEPTQRGTAFAIFAVMSGITLSFGNTFAGILNDQTTKMGLGNVGCFYGGAAATTISLILLLIYFQVNQPSKEA